MNLLTWLPFNGNTDDYSGNIESATLQNGATYSDSGKIGRCLSLVPTNAFVNMGTLNDCQLLPHRKFSIGVWVKRESHTGYIISKGHTSSSNIQFGIWLDAGAVVFNVGGTNLSHPITLDLEWNYLCLINDGTSFKMLINNEELATGVTGSIVQLDTDVLIGCRRASAGNTGTGYHYNGYINDLRIYDYCLSISERIEIMKAKILHYKCAIHEDPKMNLAPNPGYENRVYGQKYAASGWNGDQGDIYYFGSGGYDNMPFKRLVKYSAGGGGVYLDDHVGITIEDNTVYTISGYIRANKNYGGNGHILNINRVADNTYRLTDWIDITTEWKRYSWKYTSGVGHAGNYQARHIVYEDNDLPLIVEWCGFQVEKSEVLGDYIKVTEPSVCYDSSGYNNHAIIELDKAPIWKDRSDYGSGEYVFNGNQRLKIGKLFYDNVNQCHTVHAVVKPTRPLPTDGSAIGSTLINFNMGYYLEFWTSHKTLGYLNSGINDSYVYGNILPRDEYTKITWVVDTKLKFIKVYYNGNLHATSENYSQTIGSTRVPYGFANETIFGNKFTGSITDIRVYASAFSDSEVKQLCSDAGFIDTNNSLYYNNIKDKNCRSLGVETKVLDAQINIPTEADTPYGKIGANRLITVVGRTNPNMLYSIQSGGHVTTHNKNIWFSILFKVGRHGTDGVALGLFAFNLTATAMVPVQNAKTGAYTASGGESTPWGAGIFNGYGTDSLMNTQYLPVDEWLFGNFRCFPYGTPPSINNKVHINTGIFRVSNGEKILMPGKTADETYTEWILPRDNLSYLCIICAIMNATDPGFFVDIAKPYYTRLNMHGTGLDWTSNLFYDGILRQNIMGDKLNIEGENILMANSELVATNLTEQNEINQLMIMYYPFTYDTSDYGKLANNGIVYGAVRTNDKLFPSYSFSNNHDRIKISTDVEYNHEVAISVMYKRSNSSTNWRTLIGCTANIHHLIIRNDMKLCIFDGTTVVTGYTITDDEWHHIVLGLRNGIDATIHVDGVYIGTYATTLNIQTHPIEFIGNWGTGNYPCGTIGEVRVYNELLSTYHIQYLYNSYYNKTETAIFPAQRLFSQQFSEML